MLLQVQSLGVFESLSQYGALGLVTLGLGAALWFLLKRQIESEDKLKAKVDELQDELNDYVKNDVIKLTQALDNNTRVVQELKEIILSKKN